MLALNKKIAISQTSNLSFQRQPLGCWMSPSVEDLLTWSHYSSWRTSTVRTCGLLLRNSGGLWSDFHRSAGSQSNHLGTHYDLIIVRHRSNFMSDASGGFWPNQRWHTRLVLMTVKGFEFKNESQPFVQLCGSCFIFASICDFTSFIGTTLQ